MLARVLSSFAFSLFLAGASCSFAEEARNGEPLHLHVIAACGEYDAEASLKTWSDAYAKERNVRFTYSLGKDGDADLPHLDQIADADLLILFARRLKLEPEPLAKVAARWEAGKPILGIRTASHAFDNETNAVLDGQVFGGAYRNHLGDLPVEVTIREGAGESPLLAGVEPFASSKLYKAGELSKEANVLLLGRTGDEVFPVAWTHAYRGGRMFYTSLGVQEDFRQPSFRRLLDNAVRWLTESETIPDQR